MRSINKVIVLVAWAVWMAACGGGGGTSPVFTAPPPPPPPRGPIDNSVAYSTFIGMGVSGAQGGANSVVVDDAGNVYVAGFAFTTDFGATPGAFQTMYGGGFSDGFVAKFNSDGALIYLTFLGGNDEDDATDIAIDDVGNAYVVGITWSGNFPTVAAIQSNQPGGPSVFAAKLDSSGSTLTYSTYLGGTLQDTDAVVTVDSSGSAYVAGGTFSTDFPITPGSFQPKHNGSRDVFVSKLGPDGSLIYSTFVGGSDIDGQGNDIAVDATGHAYVITESFSTDFPTTPGAYQPAFGGGPSDAAVFKVAPAGDTLVYSTYLGGSDFEQSGFFGIAVDSIGSAHVIGSTASFDFPITAGAYQTTMQDQPSSSSNQALDIFVTKLNSAGDDLVFSTYIGGATSAEDGHDIAIDGNGNSYITGHTFSTDFPAVNALENVSGTRTQVVAAKLDANGSALVFSSVLGGSDSDFGESLAVDMQGNMLIVGSTFSSDYPITNAVQSDCGFPCQNGMITKIVDIPIAP